MASEFEQVLDGIEGFEWDEQKAQANLLKHEVDFRDAKEIFYEAPVVKRSDREGEARWIATGVSVGRLTAVIFTRRGNFIRIISARHARKNEERAYHQSKMGGSPEG